MAADSEQQSQVQATGTPEPVDAVVDETAGLPLSTDGGAASARAGELAVEEPQRLPDGPLHPGEVIRSLARAARCFLTYDARNEIVGRFIANYREAVERTLQTHGTLTFQIAPFDILWQGEPIYHEEDRERSLAFRLFRDGVRGMSLRPGVAWEELLRLLEILSIRYTRIRMHEEDTLTLLRQADFRSIIFEVVEVYVPAEESPESAPERQQGAHRAGPPPDWDQPLPRLGNPVSFGFSQIPEEALQALRAEAAAQSAVEAAMQVVREMLDLTARADEVSVKPAVISLLDEVCKFLVVELRPRELVWTLREARERLGDCPEVATLRDNFGQAELLDRFLRDPDDVEIDALMPLFAMVSGDHLPRVIDRFIAEPNDSLRRPLKTVLARLAMGNPDALLSRLGTVPTERVVDLFNVICVVAPPQRAIEAAYSLVDHVSPEVQLGALEILSQAAPDTRFHETMQMLLQGPTPRVRVKVANIYGRRGGTKAYNALEALLGRLAKEELESQEAAALGRGMFMAAREVAVPLLRSWIHPPAMKGLVLRAKYGAKGMRMLRWAAVAGLAGDAAKASYDLLAWLADHSDQELSQYCREVLAASPREEPANG